MSLLIAQKDRVTSKLQKGKYVYFRCSHGRGKCTLPYMREQDVSDRLSDLLKDIYVPETVARTIVASLQDDNSRAESVREQRIREVQQRPTALRTRMNQMYEDKLDGKIDEEFWTGKKNEWREQEGVLEFQLSALSAPLTTDTVLTTKRIFELANRAFSVSYAELSGTRSTVEVSAFELRNRRGKSLAYIQKAVRSDL